MGWSLNYIGFADGLAAKECEYTNTAFVMTHVIQACNDVPSLVSLLACQCLSVYWIIS